jgi:hypothetical protein
VTPVPAVSPLPCGYVTSAQRGRGVVRLRMYTRRFTPSSTPASAGGPGITRIGSTRAVPSRPRTVQGAVAETTPGWIERSCRDSPQGASPLRPHPSDALRYVDTDSTDDETLRVGVDDSPRTIGSTTVDRATAAAR